MFKTKRLNAPPPVPYVVKYGPRSEKRSGNSTSVVDFSFLRPRECPEISKCWDPSPELIEEMLKLIDL